MFNQHAQDIQIYAQTLNFGGGTGVDERQRNLCKAFLETISASTDYGVATIAISNWADSILEIVRKRNTAPGEVKKVLFFLGQVAREHSLKSGLMPRPPAAAILNYLTAGNLDLSSEEHQYVDYMWNGLPRDVMRELITIQVKKQHEFETRIDQWEKGLKEWDEKVARHENALKNFHQRYNFVELSKAFNQMYTSKRLEKNVVLILVVIFGALLALPVAAQLPLANEVPTLRYLRIEWTADQWIKALPVAALEILLLYFFRIFLRNYYSAKAQMLQIDLKQALCAFIESYVEFAREKGFTSKDQHPLSKFEGVIFSGLSPDPEKVPSSFDALEQLVKIAKDLKRG